MKRSSIQRTTKSLLNMRERIRFDLPFQRNSVWKNDRRSYLVDSVIRDCYIPNILVWDNGDGYIWVIDGRQRWESIFFFADGNYKLSKGTADFNGESIAGKRYDELSSEAQFEFLTYNFTMTEFRECSFEEVEEMFYRVNQSVPLTSTEKTRVKVGPAVREMVQELGQHLFFEKIAFTKADRNRYVDEQLIWQFIASASKQDIDFGGASLNQFISNLDEVPAPVTELVEHKIDFMDAAFRNWDQAKRKVLKKVHVGSLFQVVDYALEHGWSEDQFEAWTESFLIDRYSVDSPYGQICQKGATSKGFVAKRLDLMLKDMNQFPLQLELPHSPMDHDA
ncbi:hypothetical protein ASL14_19315 [Paenibacillus sp. IHB B 3084]|uniref:DUF262 domain-containing protein n=1 Tax=Paenibacillus sp. IHB B 3084 TaxID=867076 RepID=UPI0007209907|nr:DUF262 domain-containing protein [Paenibacillus sp. IHB B 3084]ALP38018.1 hypothetical protein ASL14_19315 [Paenibacillus sp. IHB B 3084]